MTTFADYLNAQRDTAAPEVVLTELAQFIRDNHVGDTGSLFGSIGRSISRAAKSVSRGVSKTVGKVTRPLAVPLAIVKTGAGFVPGTGTAIAAGIGTAEAIGRGESLGNIALAAGREAVPPHARPFYDMGVGLLKGRKVSSAVLNTIRQNIPGGPQNRAVFDAAIATAGGATKADLLRAASRLSSPAAREVFARITVRAARVPRPAAVVRRLPGGRRMAIVPLGPRLPPRSRVRAMRASRAAFNAMRSILARARDVRGLEVRDGKAVYVVERGDSAWRITERLIGQPARHRELFAANPKKTLVTDAQGNRNFRYLNVGEVLFLPQKWLEEARALLAETERAEQVPPVPPEAVTGSPVATLPAPGSPPGAPGSVPPAADAIPAPPVVTPTEARDDAAGVAQAKVILAAWGKTDGAASAGVSEYGGMPPDLSPIWGPRDTFQLRSFVDWSNRIQGTKLPLSGDLDQAKLAALQAWAERRARAAVTVPPVVPLAPGTPSGQATATPAPLQGAIPAGGTLPSEPMVTVPPPRKSSPLGEIEVDVSPAPVVVPETSISGTKKPGGGSGDGWLWLLGGGVGLVLLAGSGRRKRKRAA